jgi:Asp-tRNA(Asn)/Glu-tRNA(Gln) amidotransferase A subunit family amidase
VKLNRIGIGFASLLLAGCSPPTPETTAAFRLEEATIADIHNAIRASRITCTQLVQAYVNRARVYGGVCTRLVTKDGAPVPAATGHVRAGSRIVFPTETAPVSSQLPDFPHYGGPPIEFGRMESTVSDPSVQAQHGWRVGIPEVGQLNALETLNLRGERSVTCKGAFDAHPSTGPLRPEAPAVCEDFRQQPDALERAAELDAQFGANPDLDRMPMYCIPFAFKDVVDTKDMRTTANADVNYAMDVPPFDSRIVAELRAKGAIIYAKANAHEYNAGPGNPGGPATPREVVLSDARAISSWSGQACNPYDTEREPRGSSSGSGVAVAANLVTVAICEQTGGSCKGPASRNNVVSLLTTNNIIAGGGGFPNQFITDRFGITARTVADAVRTLDAFRNPERGYFDSGDIYSALPRALIPEEAYASFLVDDAHLDRRPLDGMRLGVVREYFVKHAPNDAAISDQLNGEIKRVLRDRLGAELVESVDPLYPDDPEIPNMPYTFQDALAEVLPRHMPEYLLTRVAGELEFAVPGHDVSSYDYMLKLSKGLAPLSDELNLRRITAGFPNALTTRFGVEQYLMDRGDARVRDWESLFANARWRDDAQRAGAENWVHVQSIVSDGSTQRIKMREVGLLVLLKVMHENDLDAFVAPENTLPPRKIGGPSEPTAAGREAAGATQNLTALLGIPEIVVPAGYNDVVYEPRFELSADRTRYVSVSGTMRSSLPHPMPVGLMFWAGPGDEPTLIRAASVYEAATKHRVPPSAFGPLPDEP